LSPAIRAEAILQQMIQNHYELVNTICFNICIEAYAKLGRPDKAEEILWKMQKLYQQNQQQDISEKDRFRPNLTSFNSAIKAWTLTNSKIVNRDPENAVRRAELLLERMEDSAFPPSIESYTLLMQAVIKTSDPGEKVQAILDQLEERYANGDILDPPSSVCYLVAIQAWGRAKSTKPVSPARNVPVDEISPPEMAEMLVQRMTDWSSNDSSRGDLKPCVMIYTALIDAWGNSPHPEALDHALRIFTDMQQGKLGRKASPNTVTLNVLLKAYCRHGRIDDAWELLTRMKNFIAPDLKSYHTIIKAFTRSNVANTVELAQEIVHNLEKEYQDNGNKSLKPNEYTYSQLLVALGNSRRHDAAIQAENAFWKMMNQDGTSVKPTTYHLNCVLRAWLRCLDGGAAERAEALLERAQRTGHIQPDGISHLHMIQIWIRSGRIASQQKVQLHLENVRTLCNEDDSSVLGAAVTTLSKASWYFRA
jgi:pentatricopeptide repeat protein